MSTVSARPTVADIRRAIEGLPDDSTPALVWTTEAGPDVYLSLDSFVRSDGRLAICVSAISLGSGPDDDDAN